MFPLAQRLLPFRRFPCKAWCPAKNVIYTKTRQWFGASWEIPQMPLLRSGLWPSSKHSRLVCNLSSSTPPPILRSFPSPLPKSSSLSGRILICPNAPADCFLIRVEYLAAQIWHFHFLKALHKCRYMSLLASLQEGCQVGQDSYSHIAGSESTLGET